MLLHIMCSIVLLHIKGSKSNRRLVLLRVYSIIKGLHYCSIKITLLYCIIKSSKSKRRAASDDELAPGAPRRDVIPT